MAQVPANEDRALLNRLPPVPARTGRSRAGLTLVEILVVIGVLGLILAVTVPTMAGVFDLQRRAAAKELAQTYQVLVDEAALRNVTFRVAYDLDANSWKVEVGDPNTLVFGSPEEREAYEQDLHDKMSRYTERELEEGRVDDELLDDPTNGQFEGLQDSALVTEKSLPSSTRIAFVYTPQYGPDGARSELEPGDELPEEDEDRTIAYTYVFPDGSAEHTVVRLEDAEDPEDGYTIEVEPLTGKVNLSLDVLEPGQSLAWLPVEGPVIP